MAETASLSAGSHGGAEHSSGAADPTPHVHVMPVRVLAAVWIALMVLTVLTVAVTVVDFGDTLNLWVALGIATVKASLVALYFMHLRYDHPFNSLILITALLFVILFIGITMMDSEAYQPTLIEGYAPEIQR
jgi:cytochrome c oxidase subunit 4